MPKQTSLFSIHAIIATSCSYILVFGHLNEIFVTEDGCVDDDLISEYMKIQKKNGYKKDLSDHFIESDESRKGIGGRSTSL